MTNLPHGNNVEYKFGAKILTQRFTERDEVRYDLSELKLSAPLTVNDREEDGHSFEFGVTSADGKLSQRPPKKLVIDITHETPTRKGWHFPQPHPWAIEKPNASFTLTVVADGRAFPLTPASQIELKKDLPSDPVFYESYISELSFADFLVIAAAQSVTIQFGPKAKFDLDANTRQALKYFADIVGDVEPWEGR